MLKYNTEQIVEKFKEIHKDKYDYSKFNYLGNREKSLINCPVHGDFLQHSNAHLSGQGCRKCFIDKNTYNFISAGWKKNREKRKQTFIEECKTKNSNLTFDKTVYTTKRNSVTVTCPIHGDYNTKPRLLLQGVLCRKCYYQNLHERWSKTGWLKYCNLNNILTPSFYLIRMTKDDEIFLKFGITTKQLSVRLGKYPSVYTIEVLINLQGNPEKIWNIEQYLKTKYKPFRYRPIIKFGGSTQECLIINALNEILNDKTMCLN